MLDYFMSPNVLTVWCYLPVRSYTVNLASSAMKPGGRCFYMTSILIRILNSYLLFIIIGLWVQRYWCYLISINKMCIFTRMRLFEMSVWQLYDRVVSGRDCTTPYFNTIGQLSPYSYFISYFTSRDTYWSLYIWASHPRSPDNLSQVSIPPSFELYTEPTTLFQTVLSRVLGFSHSYSQLIYICLLGESQFDNIISQHTGYL